MSRRTSERVKVKRERFESAQSSWNEIRGRTAASTGAMATDGDVTSAPLSRAAKKARGAPLPRAAKKDTMKTGKRYLEIFNSLCERLKELDPCDLLEFLESPACAKMRQHRPDEVNALFPRICKECPRDNAFEMLRSMNASGLVDINYESSNLRSALQLAICRQDEPLLDCLLEMETLNLDSPVLPCHYVGHATTPMDMALATRNPRIMYKILTHPRFGMRCTNELDRDVLVAKYALSGEIPRIYIPLLEKYDKGDMPRSELFDSALYPQHRAATMKTTESNASILALTKDPEFVFDREVWKSIATVEVEEDVVQWLIDRARAVLTAGEMQTGLYYAVQRSLSNVDNRRSMQLIHQPEFNVSYAPGQEYPIPLYCVFNGQIDVLKKLQALDSATATIVGDDGRTMLHYSCACKQPTIVGWLVDDTNVDVLAKSESGKNALQEFLPALTRSAMYEPDRHIVYDIFTKLVSNESCAAHAKENYAEYCQYFKKEGLVAAGDYCISRMQTIFMAEPELLTLQDFESEYISAYRVFNDILVKDRKKNHSRRKRGEPRNVDLHGSTTEELWYATLVLCQMNDRWNKTLDAHPVDEVCVL